MTDASPVRRIAFVMAMRAEAHPVIERLELTEVPGPDRLPVRWFDGTHGGLQIRLALNGVDVRHGVDLIGTQPATLTTHVTADRFEPDLIVSAGAAGGWASAGTRIGDVIVSDTALVFHDRRIPLAGFDQYGHGRYPVIDASGFARRHGFRTGVVSTSNSLDGPEPDASIMRAHAAAAKEMEAAAVGWVADTLGIPVLAVKAITDHVDQGAATAAQFDANLDLAIARLVEALVALLVDLDGNPLSHLAT
ncbi:MAG: 5'-methylthioadenosine nucleosidase [Actinomycetota bacterium]